MQPELRERILELWNEGYTKKKLAEILGMKYSTLCKITLEMGLVSKKGLAALSPEKREEVARKIKATRMEKARKRAEELEKLLRERGPMFVSDAAKALGWGVATVKKYARIFSDKFEKFTISTFSRGRYSLSKLFEGSRIRLHIISLKGDERIVDFFASIIRKPVSKKRANAIARKLNPVLGRETTQKIIEKVKRTKQHKIS